MNHDAAVRERAKDHALEKELAKDVLQQGVPSLRLEIIPYRGGQGGAVDEGFEP